MDNRVGFIGLGTMGLPMVTNLAKAGVALVVHDASPAALAAARTLQGDLDVVASPRGVAERATVLFTCLPDGEIVRQETRKPYDEAMARGWGTQDFSAVTHVIEQHIGRTISAAEACRR